MPSNDGVEFGRWYTEDPRDLLFHSSEVIEVDVRGEVVLGWVHTKSGNFVHICIAGPVDSMVSDEDPWPSWPWRILLDAISVDEFHAKERAQEDKDRLRRKSKSK